MSTHDAILRDAIFFFTGYGIGLFVGWLTWKVWVRALFKVWSEENPRMTKYFVLAGAVSVFIIMIVLAISLLNRLI
jgi:hypothetical protein